MILDPEKKRIAQEAKFRHKKHCRRCEKNLPFNAVKCSRCGSKNLRKVNHGTKKTKRGS